LSSSAFGARWIDGHALINGRPWDDLKRLRCPRAAGSDARLEARDGLDRFDILPGARGDDGAVAAFDGTLALCGQH
jgi:hypothetical protein